MALLPKLSLSSRAGTHIGEQFLWEYGILRLCEELHMSLNGSADPFDPFIERTVVDYLRKRLQNWKRPLEMSLKYDNAVRELIVAVLAEYSRRIAARDRALKAALSRSNFALAAELERDPRTGAT